MEFLLIWLLISVEKFATLAAKGTVIFWCGLAAIAVIYIIACLAVNDSEEFKTFLKKSKKYRVLAGTVAVFGMMLSVTSVILPTKKELAVIIGAGVTYNVLTSADAQEIGGKSITILKNKINEILEEQTAKQETKVVPPAESIKIEEPTAPASAKKVSNIVEQAAGIDINKVIESASIISKNSVDVGADIIKNKIDDVTNITPEVKQTGLPKAI